MIREFFAPRFTLVFVALLFLIWFGLFVWFKGSTEQHHRWLTHARLAVIAAVVSLVLTIGLVILVQVFD